MENSVNSKQLSFMLARHYIARFPDLESGTQLRTVVALPSLGVASISLIAILVTTMMDLYHLDVFWVTVATDLGLSSCTHPASRAATCVRGVL